MGLARAAKTNTPAIYRRFRDREDILRALLLILRNEWVQAIRSAGSLEDSAEAYIEQGLKHQREYEFNFSEPTLRPAESRTLEIGPGFAWAQAQCAERFGGSPAGYGPTRLGTLGACARHHNFSEYQSTASTTSRRASRRAPSASVNDGFERGEREFAEEGVDFVDGETKLAFGPGAQKAEQAASQKLDHRLQDGGLRWRGGRGKRGADFFADEVDHHLVQKLFDACTAWFADHGSIDIAVRGNVLEDLVAESEQAMIGAGVARERTALLLSQAGPQMFESTKQEIFFVVEVRIEGSAAEVGAINDVLHGERLEASFLDQGE